MCSRTWLAITYPKVVKTKKEGDRHPPTQVASKYQGSCPAFDILDVLVHGYSNGDGLSPEPISSTRLSGSTGTSSLRNENANHVAPAAAQARR